MIHSKDIELAQRLADAAGEAIRPYYRADFATDRKADASPVTEADERAEQVIVEILSESLPDIPVVAEEACAAGRIPDTDSTFILVDPLDGTKEFINRRPDFTVNIALVEQGQQARQVVAQGLLQGLEQRQDPIGVANELHRPLNGQISGCRCAHTGFCKLVQKIT